MADTKISALTAAAAAAVANEFAINEAGTSKKVTLAQIMAQIMLTKKLGSDFVSAQSPVTTMGKATNLDLTLPVGTWAFDYRLIFNTSTAATAVKFGVNFSGTQTRFLVEGTGFEATTAASTGAQTAVHAAFGLRAGGQNNAPSTTAVILGPTAMTITVDHFAVIRGLVEVTVAGDLQLYFGSEATGSTQTLEAPTSLVAWKVA